MRRAYITDWRDKGTVGMRTEVEVFFSFGSLDAHPWPTQEQAQNECNNFNSYGIKVEWAEGGSYVCKDFQVQERSPRAFVIFCDGPFISKVPHGSTS